MEKQQFFRLSRTSPGKPITLREGVRIFRDFAWKSINVSDCPRSWKSNCILAFWGGGSGFSRTLPGKATFFRFTKTSPGKAATLGEEIWIFQDCLEKQQFFQIFQDFTWKSCNIEGWVWIFHDFA